MQYCPHCMQPTAEDPCQRCHKQINWTAPSGQLDVGTVLRSPAGRSYTIGAAKGQGGFGITYAALDMYYSRRVAVKEYYPGHCAERHLNKQVCPVPGQETAFREGMQGFLEEARLLSLAGALPSVVSVRDYFEYNGTAYLVMEYVDGKPLDAVVRERGKMPKEELLPLLPGLLRDLGILHRSGLIHRDISPDNLILTPSGQLKLLDFGAARAVHSGGSAAVLHKPGFSPVEQYRDQGQGPHTDVYALAATVYYCLTGRIPTPALERVGGSALPAPNSLGAGLTDAEQRSLFWGLELAPESRPQTVEDLAAALLQGDLRVIDRSRNDRTENFDRGNSRQNDPPRKKKSFLPALLGGIAAAAVLAAVLLLNFGSKSENGFDYKIRGGEVYITGYDGMLQHLTVPDTLGDRQVVGIARDAFRNNSRLVSVTVPAGVEELESGAFHGCTNLELVTLCGRETAVAGDVFDGCGELRCVFTLDEGLCQSLGSRFSLEQTALCYRGQELAAGVLETVRVSGGVAYGITDRDVAVVLMLSSDMGPEDLPAMVDSYRVFAQGANAGITDDGFLYEIRGDHVALVGYSGEAVYVYMPDSVQDLPVTVVTSGCLSGNRQVESVMLPAYCEQVEADAFAGCTNLRDVYFYSEVHLPREAFAGCDKLRCLLLMGQTATGKFVSPPDNCVVLSGFIDTGAGKLRYVQVDDNGVIYGITEEDQAVVLSIPAGLEEVRLPNTVDELPLTWVWKGALADADSDVTVVLGENTGFDYDILYEAVWDFNSFGDFAHSWIVTSVLCSEINAGWNGSRYIRPDRALIQAAMTRAPELEEYYGANRPDGSDWSTVLKEQGLQWDSVLQARRRISTDEEVYDQEFDEVLEDLIDTFSKTSSEGDYYDLLGIAMHYSEDDGVVYVCGYGLCEK